MTCSGCIASIKNNLLMHPDIINADINLPDYASITMQRHLSLSELQKAIGEESKYRITKDSDGSDIHAIEGTGFQKWLATYKPLFLIFLFITGLSFLTSFEFRSLNMMDWMKNFMAGFFIVFSFFKLLNLKGFADSYAKYDLLAKRLPSYGFVYPFIELGLGIAYLTELNMFVTNGITIAIMGFSSIGVIQSVLNKRKLRCACLGDVFNLPMSSVTIIEDMVMLVMAVSTFYTMQFN